MGVSDSDDLGGALSHAHKKKRGCAIAIIFQKNYYAKKRKVKI